MNNLNYEIVRSKRRTVAIEVCLDGTVKVRCPQKCSNREIEKFVAEHKAWIEKTVEQQRLRSYNRPAEPTADEVKALKQKAKTYIPKRVKYFEGLTGLKATSVKITSAKTRHGSCNAKNGLCFSWRLMLYPEDAIDYVIVHELAHTVHHNHSRRFWSLVQQIMPDYKERKRLLK